MRLLARPAASIATHHVALGTAVVIAAVGTQVARGLTEFTAFTHHLPAEFWVLAALAVVADVRPFPPPGAARRFATVFVSTCFTFAIMLLWGAGPAIVVQIVAVVGASLRLRHSLAQTVFIAVRFSLALLAAEAVLELSALPPFARAVQLDRTDVLAVLAAASAWFVVNYAILAVGLRRGSHGSWRHTLTRTFGYELLSTGALLLLAPILVSVPSGWMVLLVAVPLVAVNQLGRISSEQEEQLRHDQLTGLLNRRALRDEVDDLTAPGVRAAASGGGPPFALLLLDLDRFKDVNDALGHSVGDRLLAAVAQRLTLSVRHSDLVARLGGDEFAVLAPNVVDIDAAHVLASHIRDALRQPAYLDGLPLYISASVGIALRPVHGNDFVTLMRHADVAMYEAKRRGDTVAIYTAGADHSSPERLSLLADLRRALVDPDHADEITFHYQPQVAIATGKVVGVEALVRWQHPERGIITPEELVRAAEHSSVMQLLTQRAVDDVVAQLGRWQSRGIYLDASINVSARDLHTTELVEHVAAQLRRTGVDAHHLRVEITETALMADPRRVLTTARQLAKLGVMVSLDDFGTGYSSLMHLRRFPLAEVKIDRSFVRRMADDPYDASIVHSIIDLARSLGLRVVAEGVEDEATSRLLAEAGCDIAQGWYYGKAVPAADLTL
jgi:diguanylate cyclase (GGDEF)-like protein